MYEYDNSTSDDNYYESSESDDYSVEDQIDEDNVRIVDGYTEIKTYWNYKNVLRNHTI